MSSEESAARSVRARIIVVEDSFPVAASLRSLLQSAGCDIVGMAGNVASALELISTVPFDVALLDIDLRGEHVVAVAEAARERGKAVIFISGYGDAEVLPPHLRSLPRLGKPTDANELFAAIERALAITSRE